MDARLTIEIQPATEHPYTALPDGSYETCSQSLFELAYPLIARPIKQLFTAFFKRDDGDYRLEQPVIDTLMWIGYPFMILHEDAFLIRAAYARLKENGQLLFDIFNPELRHLTRWQHFMAGLIAMNTAIYLSLQCATLPYLLMNNETDYSLTLNPIELVDEFMELSLFMQLCGSIMGYIGLTMGYLLGKELVLRDIPNAIHRVALNVSVDYLFRESHQQYKAWMMIDLPSRLLEEIASTPAWLMKLASRHTKQLTTVNEWLADNGLSDKENYENHHLDTSWRATVSGCLGWGKPTKRPTTTDLKYAYLDLNTTCMQYNTLLEQKKLEYRFVSTRCYSLFKPKNQQAALEHDLIDHYLKDRVNLTFDIAPSNPVLPRSAAQPLSLGWNIAAIREPDIRRLLEGKLPNNHHDLLDLAKQYQTSLYLFYSKARPCATPSSYPSRRSSSQVPSFHLADNEALIVMDAEKTSRSDEQRKTPSPK